MRTKQKTFCNDYVFFNGKNHLLRGVELEEFGDCTVAGISLQDELLDEETGYVSDAARSIDEGIFFYVEDEYLNKSEKDLTKYIEENL